MLHQEERLIADDSLLQSLHEAAVRLLIAVIPSVLSDFYFVQQYIQ